MAKTKKATVSIPLVAIDAGALTREAGAAFVRLCQGDGYERATDLMMNARNDLAAQVDAALGPNEGEMASVLTDIAVRHVIRGLTPEAVLVLVQSHPELVLEAERLVAASRAPEV